MVKQTPNQIKTIKKLAKENNLSKSDLEKMAKDQGYSDLDIKELLKVLMKIMDPKLRLKFLMQLKT